MEQAKHILQYYDLGKQLFNYEEHAHDPDMWSSTFIVNSKKYLLVEVESIDDDLLGEEYKRLEDDLHIKRTDLKLVMPKRGHAQSDNTSIGINDAFGMDWVLFEVQGVMQLLTEAEAEKVEQGEALDKDYFYLPVIYYSEQTPDFEEDWYSLRFNKQDPPASLLAYASKVPAGQTLWQAVRHDLDRDFHYARPKSFVIEEARPFDTAKTKDGRELTRFLVWVGVYEKFNTTGINPVGTHPFWAYEGGGTVNPITVEPKATAASLPFGKYLDPNTLGKLKVLSHVTIDPAEPEDLYLIQDVKSGQLYCCYDFQDHMGGGSFEDPEEAMRTFLAGYLGTGLKITMLTPKNKDWFVTCHIARVHKK